MNRKDLHIGKVYRCKLSGENVLIVSKEEAITSDSKKTELVFARYFNRSTGLYETFNVIDGQLDDSIKEPDGYCDCVERLITGSGTVE